MRKVWTAADIIVESDGAYPLLDTERFARIYGKLHLAVDSRCNADFRAGGPLPPRYGRYLCMCNDYASHETCVLVAALRHFAMRPSEDSWAPTQKIRKGKGEAPPKLQSLRSDIRRGKKTPSDAYKGERDPTPASQINEADSADNSPLIALR